jgi:hypothetical protein
VELLGVDHHLQAVAVAGRLLNEVQAVQLPLARRLDRLPRHGLVAVVLGRDRPDHLARELAAVGLKVALLVGQVEIHAGVASGVSAPVASARPGD